MSISDKEVRQAINFQLDKAEANYSKVRTQLFAEGLDLLKAELSANKIDTNIPGFNTIEENKPEVAKFIALVLDIRGSTHHLLQTIKAKATQLERVLYETTAINTMGLLLVNEYKGSITEFLGDGFLALFKIEDLKTPNEVYNAHKCAKNCLRINSEIITEILKDRYSLPALDIGIGLAYSPAIVTVIGFNDNMHPKAIGECVYRASKISKEYNAIRVDSALEKIWPTSKGGSLKFINKDSKYGFDSYIISKKQG
jgi:hypothetical protein